MRKLIIASIIFWVGVSNPLTGEERNVVDLDNQFGGETIEAVYSKEDNEYKLFREEVYYDGGGSVRMRVGYRLNNEYNPLKIKRAVEFYSKTGELERIEIEFVTEKAVEIGYHRSVTHYTKEGVKSKQEFYYNQSDFDVMVYKRSIDYFSAVGKRVRSEFYLTDKEVEKSGFYKIVSYYEGGEVVKQEMYDTKGGVF